jgi:DNA-binding XRE family transcriptional regulator
MTEHNHPENRGHNLAAIRRDFGATQSEMAMMMGLPFRTYQDIETGRSTFREAHHRALEMAMLRMAAMNLKADKLPADLKALVRDLAGMLDDPS